MDMNLIFTALGTVGFPSVVAVYLLWKQDKDKKENQENINKKDEQNRQFTNDMVNKQEVRIAKLEDKSEREHALFSDAVSVFRESVTMLSGKMDGIDCKVSKVEKDINELKSDK